MGNANKKSTMKERHDAAELLRFAANNLDNPELLIDIGNMDVKCYQNVVAVSQFTDVWYMHVPSGPAETNLTMQLFNLGKIELHNCAECGKPVKLYSMLGGDCDTLFFTKCINTDCSKFGCVHEAKEPVDLMDSWNKEQSGTLYNKNRKEFFKTHPKYCPVCGDEMEHDEYGDWVCSGCYYEFDPDNPGNFN